MASVSGAQTTRTLLDIIPQYPKSKIEVGSVRLKNLVGISSIQCSTSRFPKLEECAHFHYDHVDLRPIQLALIEEDNVKGDFDGITLKVTSGHEAWQIRRSFDHFCKLDQQLHKCVFDRKFSELPVLSKLSPKTDEETRSVLKDYVSRLSAIGCGCAISCGPALSWFELDNRGRRIVAAGQGINTPAVAAAFATTPYTASATDELSFQIGDMISVIDMPPAEESIWWRGKRGFVVGFFPSNCVAVITDKIPNEIALAEPSKPVLRKHGKLIAFFRAFILSRPSRRRLKQSGILKERVFGCDLSEHLLNSGREIPLVLKCCSEFIEAHGIVDGIYRLSGVTSNIQRLRSVFDEDRVPSLTEDSNIKQDIHSVASLLKMYFRELPNPLCTYQLYDEFVAAVQSPPEHRIERMRRTVRKLPPPHYRTLEYLMGHLGRVCGHSSGTGMTARNVAIVWAPNLLRCRSLDQGVAALQGVGVQAVVTEFLILYAPAIFGTHDVNDTRPKSLAVCSPTKLLSLEEAQARGRSNRVQYVSLGKGSEEASGSEKAPCYHTVIDFPRKRPALNWKTIFTPRRSHQTKSPRRFKRKTVIKSAEYLPMSGGGGPPQTTNANTHSRSVSHDSYFDTGPGDHPSCSSLIETQHEGLSLSLDLSELQMNFDVEESEMRIFSEDETNQLFSSGGVSLVGSADNLEQRFSSQELRYIDSYSPEPTDSPSETSPRYQPLLTPSSYENLKVNNGDCVPSSQRTSASYAYEKLAESPVLEAGLEGSCCDEEEAEEEDGGAKEVRCENELYEGCFEQMDVGATDSSYEPISPPPVVPTYENQPIHPTFSDSNLDANIYEDVQELTPSEIYCQVSYLRNSVEELNQFVLDSANDEKHDSLSSSEKKDCISLDEDDERVVEEEVGVYQEIINSPEEGEKLVVAEGDGSVEHSHSLEPLITDEKLPLMTNQTLRNNCNISVESVPERGGSDKILDSSNGTNYEIVDFVSNKKIENIFDNKNNEVQIESPEESPVRNLKCDTKLSVPVNEVLDDKVSSSADSEEIRESKAEGVSLGGSLEATKGDRCSGSGERTEKLRRLWEGESDAERRERIEKYKEERRLFLRQKYGSGGTEEEAPDEGDALIRRIKQRTLREPRSPTKTTVSISYSPARVPSLGQQSSPEKKERLDSA